MSRFQADDAPKALKTTAKVVATIGILSVCAANLLSASHFDTGTLARLAASTNGQDDPLTTGSLARSAAQTRLDPCVAPLRR